MSFCSLALHMESPDWDCLRAPVSLMYNLLAFDSAHGFTWISLISYWSLSSFAIELCLNLYVLGFGFAHVSPLLIVNWFWSLTYLTCDVEVCLNVWLLACGWLFVTTNMFASFWDKLFVWIYAEHILGMLICDHKHACNFLKQAICVNLCRTHTWHVYLWPQTCLQFLRQATCVNICRMHTCSDGLVDLKKISQEEGIYWQNLAIPEGESERREGRMCMDAAKPHERAEGAWSNAWWNTFPESPHLSPTQKV